MMLPLEKQELDAIQFSVLKKLSDNGVITPADAQSFPSILNLRHNLLKASKRFMKRSKRCSDTIDSASPKDKKRLRRALLDYGTASHFIRKMAAPLGPVRRVALLIKEDGFVDSLPSDEALAYILQKSRRQTQGKWPTDIAQNLTENDLTTAREAVTRAYVFTLTALIRHRQGERFALFNKGDSTGNEFAIEFTKPFMFEKIAAVFPEKYTSPLAPSAAPFNAAQTRALLKNEAK